MSATTFDRYVLPLLAVVVAAVAALAADRLAAVRRRPQGERGDFWAAVTAWSCLVLAAPVLLSEMLATILPQYWRTGRHLELDRVGVFGWSIPASYRIALLLPFLVWGGLLLLNVTRAPGGEGGGRWLAGAIGFGARRAWVLGCALPLAAICAWALPRLGGGLQAYPAAAWGTQAILVLSLVGVAASAGAGLAPAAGATSLPVPTPPALRPWPEALAAHGIQLRRLAFWAASPAPRDVRPQAQDFAARLRSRGARAIAPELIEAVSALASARASEGGPVRIVFAPDGCGQVEAVALAAEQLERQFHGTTLVVVPGGAPEVAARLQRWLTEGRQVVVVDQQTDLPQDALIWVVSAQVLSDRLLPMLRDPALVKRFGLVVWWHLEAYTGVVAANLWAISRRLHRLLHARGRQDVRTLALTRAVAHGDAQLAAFVRRLLPHAFPRSCEVHVDARRFPRPVQLHLLESHHSLFARGQGANVQERLRHLPLVAARVSVEEGWATHLEVPDDVARPEAAAFLQLQAGQSALGDQLQQDSTTAAARLTTVGSADVLSLVERFAQGGRAADGALPHHVALGPPLNPYVRYLLSTLGGREGASFPTSRRLVAAEALPSIIRRHLMLALNELPDTREGLLRNFLWNKEVIQSTLDAIYREGKLSRVEVRFLGEDNRLGIDHEYTSQLLPSGELQPLDTVGTDLVEVCETGGEHVGRGVRMRVDPERITVQAYPHRVFMHGGDRYHIRAWTSVQDVLRHGRLTCEREEIFSHTWRLLRDPLVFAIHPAQAPVAIGQAGKRLSRFAAAVRYEEHCMGALRWSPDLTSGKTARLDPLELTRPVSQTFDTRALVLGLPKRVDPIALASLAQALRHLLPVHLGVEEDAVEVVPLQGDALGGLAAFGLALVDLYPGGIGLVDEIGDDGPFLLQLLAWARDWLAACPCQSDQGCDRCLRSPAALAANWDQPPQRGAALELLEQMV